MIMVRKLIHNWVGIESPNPRGTVATTLRLQFRNSNQPNIFSEINFKNRLFEERKNINIIIIIIIKKLFNVF